MQAIDSAGEGRAKRVEPEADGHAPQDSTGSALPPITVLREPGTEGGDTLLDKAREEDARHWRAQGRPISGETLRERLGIGAARSRTLISAIRAEHKTQGESQTASNMESAKF